VKNCRTARVPIVARSWMLVAFIVVLGSLSGCVSQSTLNALKNEAGVPLWVAEGSNIVYSQAQRRFQGVGSAPLMKGFSLQTATADNAAREEVGRILASYVEIVVRDFIASGDAEDAGFSEHHVAAQMQRLTKIDLIGVELIGHWRQKKNKMIYAIAELSLPQVRELLIADAELHTGLKNFLMNEGDGIFDRIASVRE
jgi:hypothetical protein